MDYWAVLEKTLITWVVLLFLHALVILLCAWLFNIRVAEALIGAGPTVLSFRKLRICLLPISFKIRVWHTQEGYSADYALDSRPLWQQLLLRFADVLALLLVSFALLQGAAFAALESGLYQPFLGAWSPLADAQALMQTYVVFAIAEPLTAVIGLVAAKLAVLAVISNVLTDLIIKLDGFSEKRPAWRPVSEKVMLSIWLSVRLLLLLWGMALVVFIYKLVFQA